MFIRSLTMPRHIYIAGFFSFVASTALLLAVGFCSQAHAQEEREMPHAKPPPYMLIMTIHTPPGQKDAYRHIPQKNLNDCFEQAKTFVTEAKIPEGAIGISAACGKSLTSEEPDPPA